MNTTMKVSQSGFYYESADSQVDADGFNENTIKKRESSDKDQKGELEKITCTFKEAFQKLVENQKFDQVITKVDGEYKEMIQQLLLQCDTLNDLINGSIIGQTQITTLEASNFIQEVAKIKQELVGLQQKIVQPKKIDKNKLKNTLNNIPQELQQQDNIDLSLQIVDENTLNQFSQRIEVLNKKVGLNQIKKNSTADSFFIRGVELFSSNDKVNEKKEKTDFSLIGQFSYPIQENDPQNIITHCQMLKIQTNLLKMDEETLQKLQKINDQQELLNKQDQHQDLQNQFQQFQKKNEFSLNIIDEVPKLLSRLISLKQLHSQTLYLPQQLHQTSEFLDEILQSLEESSEILTILEQQIK